MNCGIFITLVSPWNRKKWTVDTWKNTEPHMLYAKWKKPDSKATYHLSLFPWHSRKCKTPRDIKWISICQGLGSREQLDYKGAWEDFSSWWNFENLDCGDDFRTIWICQNSLNCSLKRVHFTVWQIP